MVIVVTGVIHKDRNTVEPFVTVVAVAATGSSAAPAPTVFIDATYSDTYSNTY